MGHQRKNQQINLLMKNRFKKPNIFLLFHISTTVIILLFEDKVRQCSGRLESSGYRAVMIELKEQGRNQRWIAFYTIILLENVLLYNQLPQSQAKQLSFCLFNDPNNSRIPITQPLSLTPCHMRIPIQHYLSITILPQINSTKIATILLYHFYPYTKASFPSLLNLWAKRQITFAKNIIKAKSIYLAYWMYKCALQSYQSIESLQQGIYYFDFNQFLFAYRFFQRLLRLLEHNSIDFYIQHQPLIFEPLLFIQIVVAVLGTVRAVGQPNFQVLSVVTSMDPDHQCPKNFSQRSGFTGNLQKVSSPPECLNIALKPCYCPPVIINASQPIKLVHSFYGMRHSQKTTKSSLNRNNKPIL